MRFLTILPPYSLNKVRSNDCISQERVQSHATKERIHQDPLSLSCQ